MSTSSLFPTGSSTRVSAWASALGITLLLLVLVPLPAIAANVTLAWDPNSELDLAGYVLYHKEQTSTQYLDSVAVGYTTSYTMSGLEPGSTYDFVLTAFDESGNESDFSASVSASIPFPALVAAFSPSATSGSAPLAVSFTDASTGSIAAWAWTFGDGDTSSNQNPSHTYTAGTYAVSLTVTDPDGGTATATDAITVTDAVAEPETLTLLLAKYSSALGRFRITVGSSKAPEAVLEAEGWGPMTYRPASDAYAIVQNVDASPCSVVVRSSFGASMTVDLPCPVTEPMPVAAFSPSATSGSAPLAVSFTDASTGSITSWMWTFGDGATSTAQHPSHTYTVPGTYTVSLTATGPGGEDTMTKSSYISVTAPVPDSNDVVKITGVRYRNGIAKLTIRATSSEAPNATLFVEGIGEMQYNKKKQRYHLSVSPYAKPATVTVTSSHGGYATAVVR